MKQETLELLYWVAGIIVGSGIIEVSPIKLNPWTWLLSPLRKAITGDLSDKMTAIGKDVSKLQADLDDHIDSYQQDKASTARQRILRFNDEILQHQKHTKEHFDEILADIDFYEDYCADHPKYPNNKAVIAIENIKNTYKKCQEHNGFLTLDDEITEIRRHKGSE